MTPERRELYSEIFAIVQGYITEPIDPDDWDFPNIQDGEYKHRYWDMVRGIKDDSYMASLPGYQAIPILQQVLKGRGYDLTVLGYETEEEAVDDLEAIWDKVKLGMNEAPMGAALRMAERHPVRFRTKRLSAVYQRFLNIAYQLQMMRGDDYIALPVKTLGQILGVSPMRITDYRNFAKVDGFLCELAKSYYCKGGGGIGTKFRFTCNVEPLGFGS